MHKYTIKLEQSVELFLSDEEYKHLTPDDLVKLAYEQAAKLPDRGLTQVTYNGKVKAKDIIGLLIGEVDDAQSFMELFEEESEVARCEAKGEAIRIAEMFMKEGEEHAEGTPSEG